MNEDKSNWIWTSDWSIKDAETPQLVLFRRKIIIKEKLQEASFKITADSRYKLWINGNFCEVGPLKGTKKQWYLDTVNVKSFLHTGENVIGDEVLRYPNESLKGNFGVVRTKLPGLYLNGKLEYLDYTEYLSTDNKWVSYKEDTFKIVSEDENFAPLQIYENRIGNSKLQNWNKSTYNDEFWKPIKEYRKDELPDILKPDNIHARKVPFMKRSLHNFKEVKQAIVSDTKKVDWARFLQQLNTVTIKPNTTEVVEISAGEEMTAYLNLELSGGKDAQIKILQSESYVNGHAPTVNGITLYNKGDREETENSMLVGFADEYTVSGYGSKESPEEYRPFWFRTFRFIRLEIKTAATPLTLEKFDYEETGYPLDVKTQVKTSDSSLSGIWDLSELTLRRCMHETYEDCPYYEQLQYVMDTRSQILYTYSTSGDDRLARKAIDDFQDSQLPSGLLNAASPSFEANVIPGFSIYYILMLHDHMMYFDDKEFLNRHMESVDRILEYFNEHLNVKGYVDVLGGLNGQGDNWSFIDWAIEWGKTTGVPSAILSGPITMESLLYLYGLQTARELAKHLQDKELVEKYALRAAALNTAIKKYCLGKNGMIQDGPGVEQYSQHAQVFGVLTDVLNIEQGRKNLQQTILEKDEFAQCSVAMMFYLFRALEKTELYSLTDQYWNIWREMLSKNCTTSFESISTERSECHAWGALALYELPTKVLGVSPAEPGYKCIRIKPLPGKLTSASGEVWTPKGLVKVNWHLVDGQTVLSYQAPTGVKVIH